jgi:lipoprotein-releasing system permease protein
MLKLFLWLRYLRKKKMVLLSIAAVALSSALLIVVSSLFTGFIKAFEQSAVKAMGDIVIEPPAKIAKYPLFIKQLEQIDGVKAATATLAGDGLLHLSDGNVRAVKIWGIEAGKRAEVTGLKQFLLKQSQSSGEPAFQNQIGENKIGGFVGIGILGEPNETTDEYDFDAAKKKIGSEVVLTTGAVTESQASTSNDSSKNIKRRSVRFEIADVVFTGVYDLDKNFMYLPIEQLRGIIYPAEKEPIAEQIQVKLADGVKVEICLAQIRGVWQQFASEELGWDNYYINNTTIITSKQMQSRYVAELRKQMGMLMLIFGVISFSVVLLILCIFYMIVETRRKDIAIIKSCGTTNISVAMIFVGFGGFVGIIGSGLGAVIGYFITKNINVVEEWIRVLFGLKLWKSSVYMFSSIPNEVDWHSAIIIILFAILAAAIGALIPAIVAVRIRPVKILRYE